MSESLADRRYIENHNWFFVNLTAQVLKNNGTLSSESGSTLFPETTHENCGNCFSLANELDKNLTRTLEILINCILINVICVFGIIGNIINIAVLQEHGFRETTNIILVSLSASDLLFSIIVPVTRLRCLVRFFSEAISTSVHTFVTVYLFMPKYVCLATSYCYVCVIAVERFVAVFFPFHISKVFNRRTAKFLVVIIPVVTAGTLIPTFFSLTYEWTFDFRFNKTVAVLRYTRFYALHHSFIDPYTWVGLSNAFCAINILIVMLCCLAIGFKLTKAAIRRKQMTQRASGNDKVVKMLVTVCVIYLVVAIPTVSVYSYFQPNFIIVSAVYEIVDNVGVLLCSINASVNFIVYVTMSDKFAVTYKKLLVYTCAENRKCYK